MGGGGELVHSLRTSAPPFRLGVSGADFCFVVAVVVVVVVVVGCLTAWIPYLWIRNKTRGKDLLE